MGLINFVLGQLQLWLCWQLVAGPLDELTILLIDGEPGIRMLSRVWNVPPSMSITADESIFPHRRAEGGGE